MIYILTCSYIEPNDKNNALSKLSKEINKKCTFQTDTLSPIFIVLFWRFGANPQYSWGMIGDHVWW